jgi:nitrite reductase (NADH) large subunit
MAVSGCTRECAEARGKDIGIIATERGYNLYVGGNGGMKPRHADLFATDLSDEQVLRYTDRILMFYIRTADRLQRTSTWLEGLEGGLEYLKQVVIEDRLGICAELDSAMQSVADTYQDEWRTAVEDPAIRRRFSHFVNSPAADDGIRTIRVRDQRVPALSEA